MERFHFRSYSAPFDCLVATWEALTQSFCLPFSGTHFNLSQISPTMRRACSCVVCAPRASVYPPDAATCFCFPPDIASGRRALGCLVIARSLGVFYDGFHLIGVPFLAFRCTREVFSNTRSPYSNCQTK